MYYYFFKKNKHVIYLKKIIKLSHALEDLNLKVKEDFFLKKKKVEGDFMFTVLKVAFHEADFVI